MWADFVSNSSLQMMELVHDDHGDINGADNDIDDALEDVDAVQNLSQRRIIHK